MQNSNFNLLNVLKFVRLYLLLSCPQASDTLPVELDEPEGDMPLVEHDDLVVVSAVIDDVAECKKGVGTA